MNNQIIAQHALEGAINKIHAAAEKEQLAALECAASTMRPYIDAGIIAASVVWDRLQTAAEAVDAISQHGQDAVQAALKGYADPIVHKDGMRINIQNELDAIALKQDADLPALSALSALPAPLSKGAEAITGTWEEPDWSLLDDRRGDLPKFPTNAFSPPWQEWLRRAARGAGATEAHVAVPLLAIASSLIGAARLVKPTPSWSQTCTTWTAVVGPSGTGKTSGIDATKNALARIEKDRKPKIAELQREHESRAQAFKAANKKWMADFDKAAADGSANPTKPSITDPGPFITPRLSVSSVTIERLPYLLEARPSGILLIADELAGLFLNTKRYSGGQDDEFWLEAWNGGSYTVERVGRPAVSIDRLLVGITGGFQPDKLARSFSGDADGMYARICFGWPEEPSYQPLTDDVAEVEPEILNALNRIVNLPAEIQGAFKPVYLPLTANARSEFEHFRRKAFAEMAGLHGREREWWAKAQAHILRLAGTLAILDWAIVGGDEPRQVEAKIILAAIRLVRDYFWPHSRAALRLIGLSERHADARHVLLWIKARTPSEVSVEDIRRNALNQRLDARQTEALLNCLELAGWLRKTTQPTAGRSRHRWEVNPRLYRAAESAQSAERMLAA